MFHVVVKTFTSFRRALARTSLAGGPSISLKVYAHYSVTAQRHRSHVTVASAQRQIFPCGFPMERCSLTVAKPDCNPTLNVEYPQREYLDVALRVILSVGFSSVIFQLFKRHTKLLYKFLLQ